MAPRPTSLKILNLHWPVKWVPQELDTGTEKYAWAVLSRQTIFISEGLSPGKTADSFMHEVLHALWWSFYLKDKSKEEEVCRLLSSGLLMVWQDNPLAFDWLQETFLSRQEIAA